MVWYPLCNLVGHDTPVSSRRLPPGLIHPHLVLTCLIRGLMCRSSKPPLWPPRAHMPVNHRRRLPPLWRLQRAPPTLAPRLAPGLAPEAALWRPAPLPLFLLPTLQLPSLFLFWERFCCRGPHCRHGSVWAPLVLQRRAVGGGVTAGPPERTRVSPQVFFGGGRVLEGPVGLLPIGYRGVSPIRPLTKTDKREPHGCPGHTNAHQEVAVWGPQGLLSMLL